MQVDPMVRAAPGAGLGLDSIAFEPAVIEGAIQESGLAAEFDLEPVTQSRLAAQAFTICSIALGAVGEDDYRRYLGEIRAPADTDEAAFLFGFCEHVRQTLLESLEPLEPELQLRTQIKRRIDLARDLCLAEIGHG